MRVAVRKGLSAHWGGGGREPGPTCDRMALEWAPACWLRDGVWAPPWQEEMGTFSSACDLAAHAPQKLRSGLMPPTSVSSVLGPGHSSCGGRCAEAADMAFEGAV